MKNLIEQHLREETKNIFSNEWYQKTSISLDEKINKKEDNLFDLIEKPVNQHDTLWVPISEIKRILQEKTSFKSEIDNQKLGIYLTIKNFKSKRARFKGVPKKCYSVKNTCFS